MKDGQTKVKGTNVRIEGDRTLILITAHLSIFTESPTIGWPEFLGTGGQVCPLHPVFSKDLLPLIPLP